VILVHIPWHVNPFRGDKFAEGWAQAAEDVLDFGAVSWAFYRNIDGRLDFIQEAVFPSKAHFERYWYSEHIAQKRTALQGYFNVPVLPEFYEIVSEGRALSLAPEEPA
jgi:hypothetical protein